MTRESDLVCKLKLGEIYFQMRDSESPILANDEDRVGLHLIFFFSFFLFFFLQLAKNVLNNMGQSMHGLNFHIKVIVETLYLLQYDVENNNPMQ